MELLTEPAVWLGVVFMGVLAAWLKGFLKPVPAAATTGVVGHHE